MKVGAQGGKRLGLASRLSGEWQPVAHFFLTGSRFADNFPARGSGPCCKHLTRLWRPPCTLPQSSVVSRQSSVVVVLCLFATSSLTSMSFAQNVTTWHNDNNRTGWQSNE